MKFLVDAQLPVRLAGALGEAGHDAVHTLDLPDRNRTTDSVISHLADAEDRVVISKDTDFRDSHLLRGTRRRVLLSLVRRTDLPEVGVGHGVGC